MWMLRCLLLSFYLGFQVRELEVKGSLRVWQGWGGAHGCLLP